MIIEVEEIYKTFGANQCLSGITASFKNARAHALVGPNGCGKSSLLNTIAGFYRPDKGAVYLTDDGDRRCLNGISPARRALLGIGLVFQDPRGFLEFTVEENLVLSMMEQGSDNLFCFGGQRLPVQQYRSRIEMLLESACLTDYRKTPTGTLSYGQRKILDVLRLIARGCKVFLLDEPFAGVDPKNVDTMLTVLRQISKQDSQIAIIVSHEISLLSDVADQMLLMDEGRILAAGSLKDIILTEAFKGVYHV